MEAIISLFLLLGLLYILNKMYSHSGLWMMGTIVVSVLSVPFAILIGGIYLITRDAVQD